MSPPVGVNASVNGRDSRAFSSIRRKRLLRFRQTINATNPAREPGL